MAWEIEFSDVFQAYMDEIFLNNYPLHYEIDVALMVLEAKGPYLRRPYAADIKNSPSGKLLELIVQFRGAPYRIFYRFDNDRIAVILIGEMKTDGKKFYKKYIPIAERIYEEHIRKRRQV